MKGAVVGFVLFSCPLWTWAGSGQKPPEMLAITNVNVIDMRSGGYGPNLTVVMKDATIIAVAKVALLDAGSHVRIINGNGKFLIPGLWDMNAHIPESSDTANNRRWLYSLYISNGVTGLRDARLGADAQTSGGSFQPEIAFGDRLEPASTASKKLGKIPGKVPGKIQDLDEVLLAYPPEGLHRSDDPNHLDDLDLGHPTYDRKKTWDLFVNIADHGTWVLPALVSRDNTAENDLLPEERAELQEQAALDLQVVNDMRRAGVQFLAGTNGPGVNLLAGSSLQSELELLVKSGFTPFQALQTATLNPALCMAKLDQYGVVEPGRVADLVLLDENPLIDIRNTQKISGVVLRGNFLSRSDLDQLVSRAEREKDQPVDASKAAALQGAQ
jgi:hypothetical protein